MAGWMNENWSLEYLPLETRIQLADALDVVSSLGLGYPRFAAALRINNRTVYSARDVELFRVRSQPGSTTLAMLLDYEQRGGTIQGVQRALESIGHVASQIIPTYFTNIATLNSQARSGMNNSMYPQSPNSGSQNTEFTPCNCPRCLHQSQSSNMNGRANSERREQNGLNQSGNTGSSSISRGEGQSRTSSTSKAHSGLKNSSPIVSDNVVESRDQVSLRREICHCESCRLRSDPDQTHRFTLESDPKITCSVNRGIPETDLVNNTDSRLSQLYLDSYESEEASVGNSDETYVKSVSDESQKFERVELSEHSVPNGTLPTKNSNKLCSKSDNGQHRLGERPENCSVCRNYTGAIHKKESRARYNSATDRNVQDTTLRKSWHGTSKSRTNEELLKSWSDSSLVVIEHSGTNTHQQSNSNSVDETIYSRISSGRGGSSSEDRFVIRDGSVHDVYQNNLESDAMNNAGTRRNIVQSDSSNFTDTCIQNPLTRNPDNSSSDLNTLARVTNSQRDDDQHGRKSAGNGRRGPKVFVTYGWNGNTDSESFIQEVIEMCLSLRENDIRTKIDMDDHSYSSLMLNKLDWIDKNVREAKYIIVCITPTYTADIREPDLRNQASPRASQLNARYIYDKLREEYYSNSAQNRRIIPVIFSNHQTTHLHVPDCMRSTLIYEYPNNIEQIIAAILGHGRFRPS